MPHEYICECCGETFTRHPPKPPRFCSMHCRRAGRPGLPGPDDSVLVPLNKPGVFAIIDAEDAERILPFKWRLEFTGYATRCRRNPEPASPLMIRMHRVVVDEVPDDVEIDHINGNKLDNRRANLRRATRSENNRNKPLQSNNTSGFRGIAWNKTARLWMTRVHVNGTPMLVGYFKTPEEAAHAYDTAAREHYGVFARLNFPDE